MSVILFSKEEVYQPMADAYEGLKHLLRPYQVVDDEKFYKSLRRLYFANLATYLCQYHDNTHLSESDLKAIDGFVTLEGKHNPDYSNLELVNSFISNWRSLAYNLTTNDGEQYIAKEAQEYIEFLVSIFSRKVLEQLAGI